MDKKIKILTLSDHPLSPSGVGTQTKYFIEALLKTGKFQFICLGGAMKHDKYEAQKIAPYEDDWMVIPVDGYGDAEKIRSIIRNERPDILWFMTDPRFYEWLWFVENEIRPLIPMVYYHVWDNHPAPMFNRPFYLSNDLIVSISKVTRDVVAEAAPEVENIYHPHAVDSSIFKPKTDEEIKELKKNNFSQDKDDRMLFFWNNRNARRKQSGSLLFWFDEFANEVGRDNVRLIMHTDPNDIHGQPLQHIIEKLGNDGTMMISSSKVPPQILSDMYNMASCTINISDAEGFGLATLESLSCETPIVVTMTGGLQEQVTDGKDWFGIGIEPSSKTVIGSQQVPYIYEDRISKEDFKAALHKMYNMTPEERKELGRKGRQHVENNYSFEEYCEGWVKIMTEVHEKHGSWENRRNHKSWELKELT
jgi:glycosyltransferase involved in cell wall biosynthesis